MQTREQIWSSFFALISGDGTDFLTTTRILKGWTQYSLGQCPVLTMVQRKERVAKAGINQPSKHVLEGDLYIYTFSGDDSVAPTIQLNGLVDKIEGLICPFPLSSQKQTLNGLVRDCQLVGDIETDEGTLGQRAVAIVPFQIITD